MTKHDIATIILSLNDRFMQIKAISSSGDIDRFCVDGVSKVSLLGDEIAPDEIKELKDRRIDPMM